MIKNHQFATAPFIIKNIIFIFSIFLYYIIFKRIVDYYKIFIKHNKIFH